MAVDIFVKFEKPAQGAMAVVGESKDAAMKDWIEVKSISFGAEHPVTIGSAYGGAGSGKATFDEIVIEKAVDSTSPALFAAVCTGGHYEQITIAFRKAGGAGKAAMPYYGIICKMVFIKSLVHTASGGEDPSEMLKLAVGAIQMTYRKQKADGSMDKDITSAWDQISNSSKVEVLKS